jgi:uncharacterized membrane protein YecN with MAPEG domain
MLVPVTALYGALNAILNIVLASRVSSARGTDKVSIGLGNSKALELAVRIHGNNAEFMPLGVLVLLIAELSGGASMWLHTAGGILLVSRVLHVIGMPRKAPNVFRFSGTAGTWLMIAVTSVWILVMRFAS